jgi:uncharacterized glyoxalase superfamily protein PhnB
MKITAVLVVDDIESSLPFWTERIGFDKLVEVPDGERLGFVILTREGAELMLQTKESVRKDEPKFADDTASRVTSLFLEVNDFEDVRRRLRGYPIAMEERTTFYGMREIGVFDPSGHIVIFAKRL